MSSRVSATAGLVARGVAFQARHPRNSRLVPSAAADLSARFASAAGLKIRRGDSLVDRTLVAIQERAFVPGLTLHYVLRKLRIEAIARDAVAGRFRQLVVMGAGFDSLALRLAAELPDLALIEIDRAETQAVKRHALAGPSGVEFLSADLAVESLRSTLGRSRLYRPDAPALFIAEAVFLYLTADEVLGVLAGVRDATPEARLVFTFFGAHASRSNFSNATRLADLWLKWKGEPVRWAIDPGAVPSFVAAAGFRALEVIRDVDFHQDHDAARGEHIAVVEAR